MGIAWVGWWGRTKSPSTLGRCPELSPRHPKPPGGCTKDGPALQESARSWTPSAPRDDAPAPGGGRPKQDPPSPRRGRGDAPSTARCIPAEGMPLAGSSITGEGCAERGHQHTGSDAHQPGTCPETCETHPRTPGPAGPRSRRAGLCRPRHDGDPALPPCPPELPGRAGLTARRAGAAEAGEVR